MSEGTYCTYSLHNICYCLEGTKNWLNHRTDSRWMWTDKQWSQNIWEKCKRGHLIGLGKEVIVLYIHKSVPLCININQVSIALWYSPTTMNKAELIYLSLIKKKTYKIPRVWYIQYRFIHVKEKGTHECILFIIYFMYLMHIKISEIYQPINISSFNKWISHSHRNVNIQDDYRKNNWFEI